MKTWLVLIVGGGEQSILADSCAVDPKGYLRLYVKDLDNKPVIPGGSKPVDLLVAQFAPGQFAGFIDADLYAKVKEKHAQVPLDKGLSVGEATLEEAPKE